MYLKEPCHFNDFANWNSELQTACDSFKTKHGSSPNMLCMNDRTFLKFIGLAKAEGHSLFKGQIKESFAQLLPGEVDATDTLHIRKFISKDNLINIVVMADGGHKNLEFDLIYLSGRVGSLN